MRGNLYLSAAIENDENECHGCAHTRFAGVCWPTDIAGDTKHNWVRACKSCRRYANDELAATALARALGGPVARGQTIDGSTWLYVELPMRIAAKASELSDTASA